VSKEDNTDQSDTRVCREDWKKAKEFEGDGIVVIVSKLPLRMPRYSIEIAARTQFGDRKIGRHFQVHVDRKSGKASVSRIATRTLVKLVTEAETYIEDQEQLDIQAFLEWKKSQENKDNSNKSDDDEILVGKK